MKQFFTRAALGALTILAIAGCETRLTTEAASMPPIRSSRSRRLA